MTGFGRATASSPQAMVQVEIKTLNSRYLEFRTRIPKALSGWESTLRAQLSQALRRGTVEVSVTYQVTDPSFLQIVHTPTLRAYAESIKRAAADLGLPAEFSVIELLRLPGALNLDDGLSLGEAEKIHIYSLLEQALAESIEQLLQMRAREGQALTQVILRELGEMQNTANALKKMGPEIRERLQERISLRVRELMSTGATPPDPVRLVQEVAHYADRGDVTEELDRISSHLLQIQAALVASNDFQVGKKLDFLIQELLREVNTVGSKADALEITNLVVAAKLNLDRIREQVQNLE